MLEFHSSGYERVSVFVKRTAGPEDSWLCLEGPRKKQQVIHMGRDWYRMVQLPLPEQGTYSLTQAGMEIAQIYLCGGKDLMERGIRYLDPVSGEAVMLDRWYNTPRREQFHFGPFVNWANDPNALCWYHGYYHLFYQANPFEQKWNDMYWGHAVSKDLIHWRHLPHALEPQEALWRNPGLKGGAFSGCAVAGEQQIDIYLTRHEGPQEDGPETREWQTKAVCRDGIGIESEVLLIGEKPKGVSPDFRDPKVQQIGRENYMVLGSAVNEIPAILLYRENEGSWEYLGPLLTEPAEGIKTFECPDFFELDGFFVALGAWMWHRDEFGRRQMTRCYIGEFDGRTLHSQKEQWYDFGSNFYAVQSFTHENRRIAIGWISDFYGEHRPDINGACGSFSLPRELSVNAGRLCMKPAAECYGLMKELLIKEYGKNSISALNIPGSCYFVRARLNSDGDFCMVLARDGTDTLSLERTGGITELVSTKKEVEGIRFPSDVTAVRDIEIFVDRRVTEVFLNHGEGAGTKVFYQDEAEGFFEARSENEVLAEIEIWTMESIW